MRNQPSELPTLARHLSRWVEYKWVVLAVFTLTIFFSAIDPTSVFIALPALAQAFHTDTSIVVWVAITYYLVSVGLLLTFGWIGDATGRSRLIILGLALGTLGSGLAALTQDVYQLIAVRAFQGISSALILANITALLVAVFPQRERGMALGFLGIGLGIGLAMGPMIGGFLVDVLDWRAIFWARVPLGLVTLLLALLLLPRDKGVGAPQVDVAGAITLFIGLTALLLAVNQAGRVGVTHPLTLMSTAVAMVGFLLFLRVERRAPRPIIDLRFFRLPLYSMGLLSMFFMYLAYNSMPAITPFLMINGLGYSASKAGLLTLPLNAVRPLVSPLAGWLSDRTQTRLLSPGGLLFFMGGFILLSQIQVGPLAPVLLLAGFAVAGVGAAIFEPVNSSAIIGSVPPDRLGTAAASIATIRQIGLSGGAVLGAALFAAGSARSAGVSAADVTPAQLPPEALASGAEVALLVSAALCFLAMVAAIARGKRVSGHPIS